MIYEMARVITQVLQAQGPRNALVIWYRPRLKAIIDQIAKGGAEVWPPPDGGDKHAHADGKQEILPFSGVELVLPRQGRQSP